MPPRARVLVVDDDVSSVAVLERALGSLGYGVVGTTSADEALGWLGREPFDLVIADKNMPGKDGIAMIRELRARGDAVAVVLITAFASQATAAEALNLGIDAYLEKPFPEILEVGRLVERALSRRRAQRLGWPAAGPGVPSPASMGPKLELLFAVTRTHVRDRLVAHVDRSGDRVALAASARDTLSLLETSPPDVVIVDAPSFGRDAVDLVTEVRYFAPELPCLVIGDAIDLATTKSFIELEVVALIHSSQWDKLNQVLVSLRRKKLARTARTLRPSD